jgi:hypothetical protein
MHTQRYLQYSTLETITMKSVNVRAPVALAALLCCAPLFAQSAAPPQTPAQMIHAQQGAMATLAALDGAWRGSGWIMDSPGTAPRQLTQTIRAGTFLDGTVRLFEIRGYQADGSIGFHAFNTISFDPQKNSYVMTARAGGRSGNFSFVATADGYIWNIGDASQGLKYTATIKNGVWTEVGESLAPGRPPVKVSEWTLRRVGGSDWPEGGALAAQ